MKCRHQKYFNILETVAEGIEPIAGRARLSASIVYKNEIISVGYCRYKTHPLQKKYQKHAEAIYLHAELDAIVKALKKISIDDLKKSSMYIMRIKRKDTYDKEFIRALSKPCSGCQQAIKAFGIKNVYYTTEQGFEVF